MTNDTRWREQEAGRLPGLAEAIDALRAHEPRRLAEVFLSLIRTSGGAIPPKAGFDPMILGGVLSSAVLYDLRDPAHVVFRIVGDKMMRHFKVNPVGRCYLEFVPEVRRAHALSAFRHCVETPCGMLSRTIQVFDSGLATPCEALGVPLAGPDPDQPATHLLFVDAPVASAADRQMDSSPFRFARLTERRFIDLGHGVPSGFRDLVPAYDPPMG